MSFYWVDWLEYTLPQKKHKFNVAIFPGAPGFPTLMQGHVE